jgi:predicted MFS family arabinose efflux permease
VRADSTDPAGILWAVTASYTIGVLGGNMQPLLIGSLIDGLRMDAGTAGLLGSIELSAVALASFVLAPRMDTISRRVLIRVGAALATLGYISSALPESVASLAVCRVIAGVGAGMVLAIGNATVAACRHPERVFARTTIAGTILITVLLALLPLVIARFTYRGGYLGLGAITLVLAPFLWRIPDTVAGGQQHAEDGVTHYGLGIATLTAAGLLFFCQSALWAFSERIAILARLSHEQIGLALSGSTLAGLCGAALASWIGTRRGRTLPLITGILATGLTLLGLVHTGAPATYTGMLIANGIAYLFMVPYVFGTAAALDRQGRWGAATVGAATIGAAFGPGIAGPVIAAAGYTAMGWVVFIVSLLSAMAIAPVGLALDRRDLPLSPSLARRGN